MKETRNDLIKSTAIGIGIAMTLFCLTGIAYDITYDGTFRLENYAFTKMIIGCILVGLGFGIPSVIYKKDNLPMPIRILIHMGIGCVVYTIVAYAVGWIGGAATMTQGILIAVIQFATAFVIWALFMRHYRKEARQMNDRIQQMNVK